VSGQPPNSPAAYKPPALTNADVAGALERIADLLEVQDANEFRVRAYRNAAATIDRLAVPVASVDAERGLDGLEELPGIGKSIAATIHELLSSGRVPMLDRLEGQVSPEDLLASVPGIGEKLAQRIHAALGIETLEELEVAAHDGTLEGVKGVGRRKAQALRDIVGAILNRSSRRHARHPSVVQEADRVSLGPPPVSEILSVDREYMQRAKAGELRKIAPRRFNPTGEAWLPVLHTERGRRHYTALFSNTHRAHELGKTDDWVVLFYELDGHENQCTVVTERKGPLAGKRVVRGSEAECVEHYGRTSENAEGR
jgi:predicted flap endonuclease-1-like 5' DNA nuclease